MVYLDFHPISGLMQWQRQNLHDPPKMVTSQSLNRAHINRIQSSMHKLSGWILFSYSLQLSPALPEKPSKVQLYIPGSWLLFPVKLLAA